MASCGGSLAKLILCLWNLLIIVLAVGIVLVGTRKFMVPAEPEHEANFLLGIPWHTLSTGLIICGVLLGIIALTGLNAAVCESSFLLKTYVYFLALGCITAIGLCAAGWIYCDVATQEARNYFGTLMANSSKNNPDMTSVIAVNKWQKLAMCCGDMAPSDWHNRTLLGEKNNFTIVGYPPSCCNSDNASGHNGSSCNESELLYRDGCFSDVLIQWYKRTGLNLSFGVLALLLLLLSLSCCLERDRQLADSQLINQQYASHLNSCMGSGRYVAKRGSRMLANSSAIRHNGSRRTAAVPYTAWHNDFGHASSLRYD